jgi:hypothetical protein
VEQKTANFNVAIDGRVMQWCASTEEKLKNQHAQTESLQNKNNNNKGGGNYLLVFASTSALHCSKRRQISRWPLEAE